MPVPSEGQELGVDGGPDGELFVVARKMIICGQNTKPAWRLEKPSVAPIVPAHLSITAKMSCQVERQIGCHRGT